MSVETGEVWWQIDTPHGPIYGVDETRDPSPHQRRIWLPRPNIPRVSSTNLNEIFGPYIGDGFVDNTTQLTCAEGLAGEPQILVERRTGARAIRAVMVTEVIEKRRELAGVVV